MYILAFAHPYHWHSSCKYLSKASSTVTVIIQHGLNDLNSRNSLTFQWLGLGTFTTVAQVQSLVRELRSHKPFGQKKQVVQYTGIEFVSTTFHFPWLPFSSHALIHCKASFSIPATEGQSWETLGSGPAQLWLCSLPVPPCSLPASLSQCVCAELPKEAP